MKTKNGISETFRNICNVITLEQKFELETNDSLTTTKNSVVSGSLYGGNLYRHAF